MLRRTLMLVAVLLLILLLPLTVAAANVTVAEIRGAVTPASAAYFLRVLDQARQGGAALVVLRLDTPGGLDTSMREMIRAMLASPVPVAVYVAPGGARAASAGTYLIYASHVAAMAPGTNLGAATPIQIGVGGERGKPGGDEKKKEASGERKGEAARGPPADTMAAKMTEDAAAYLRSLAQLRGRNVEWAERAVRRAESLSAEDALKLKVVDVVAADVAELLRQIDGRTVSVDGQPRRLALAGLPVVSAERNWKERLLAAIADPNIALILVMIGVYGLLFEFNAPGLAAPGVIGGICLFLGLYGLALLPINYVGAALVLLGLALMVAEVFMPSFGIVGIGGVVAFVVGALMLVDADVPELQVSWGFVLPLGIASALVLAGIGSLALRSRERPQVAGREAMLGRTAVALEDIEAEGWVRAAGEQWRARSAAPLARGARARIKAVEGLTLVVEPEGEKK